ncbi:phosphatase PAP2 family protein [Candidatus Parcubacteria bacterium]|nr:phosphatase PAP2 family protein [Candidatus Parcubacteria bacterium]
MNLSRVIKNILFLLVAIFSGLTLAIVTAGVSTGSGELTPVNTAVETAISPFRTPLSTSIMLLMTNLGSPFVLSMIAVLLAVILFFKRDAYDALLYVISIVLSIVGFVLMKNALHLPRPEGSLVTELSGWSFPSGHATVATAFFFTTAYSFWSWPKSWGGKISLVTACIIAPVLVAFSRVYLSAHFALDVLAGISLGLLIVSLTILVFNIFLSEREWWRRHVRSL